MTHNGSAPTGTLRTEAGVVNVSDMRPDWNWLSQSFDHSGNAWRHVSTQQSRLPRGTPGRDQLARLEAAARAAFACRGGRAIVVSHGPRLGMYAGLLAPKICPAARHLIFSFNFTELPRGTQRRVMANAYRGVERFATFSTFERELYADYFSLPVQRFDMLHWAAQPLPLPEGAAALVAGEYACAIGGQGRDYATLIKAMSRLPHRKLVIVATPQSVAGIEVPTNVVIRCNVGRDEVANILAFSQFMTLPLAGAEVPCGHVTIVSAFHAGKAIVATDSSGVHDYLRRGETAMLCPPRNVDAMADAVEACFTNPTLRDRLGTAGLLFAKANCTERNAVDYFERFLKLV